MRTTSARGCVPRMESKALGNETSGRKRNCKGASFLLALALGCSDARAFPFVSEKDPVEPFVMYGAVYKKYWIEKVVDNKVIARKKGVTAIACTGAVSEGAPTSIGKESLPTVPNEEVPDAAACATRVGTSPEEACLAACDASCTSSVESLVIRQKEETGYALDEIDKRKVTRNCVRQCKYECTKPGQFSSFASPFKR